MCQNSNQTIHNAQRQQQSDDITDKILVVWDIQHSTTMIGAVDMARAVLQALLELEIWTKEQDQTKSSRAQLPEQQQQSNQSSSSSSVLMSSSSSVGCITWVILGPQQCQQWQCQPRRGSNNNNNNKNNSISVDVVMDSSNAMSVMVKVEEETSATTRAILERENTTVVETMALDWTPSIAPGFE